MTTPTSNSQLREAIENALIANEAVYGRIPGRDPVLDRILTAITPLVEEMQKDRDNAQRDWAATLADLKTIQADRDELKKDRERLDWWDKHPNQTNMDFGTGEGPVGVHWGIGVTRPCTIRAAIDAARASSKGTAS